MPCVIINTDFKYEKGGFSVAVSDKIKAGLRLNGVEIKNLADFLEISRQSMSNKFHRNSFSAQELIRIADFLGYSLAFVGDKQNIMFDITDAVSSE
jgi:lambda repressor-like predicted transcriptional regulator